MKEVIQGIAQFPISLTVAEADGVTWKCGEDDYSARFVAAGTWHLIRERKVEVQWHRLIWFPQGVPRYDFISWLTVWDRLRTGHRTSKWGQPQVCLFSGEPDETRHHLFFACTISFTTNNIAQYVNQTKSCKNEIIVVVMALVYIARYPTFFPSSFSQVVDSTHYRAS